MLHIHPLALIMHILTLQIDSQSTAAMSVYNCVSGKPNVGPTFGVAVTNEAQKVIPQRLKYQQIDFFKIDFFMDQDNLTI